MNGPARFAEFISPGADRFTLLRSVLKENGLSCRVLALAGKRHIVLSGGPPGDDGEDPWSTALSPQTRTIFTAHYDRTANSPGANDNGAAVFQLVETALILRRKRREGGKDPLFIFTDGEELSGGESLKNQGSYSLGIYLKERGLGNGRIFTFDACGTGDTLIISTTAEELLKNKKGRGAESARHRARVLRGAALEAARRARLEQVMLLPTPFSEDAGFLRSGMAAQTITVLPREEAASFASLVRRRGGGLASLFSAAGTPEERPLPETWRILNGPGDSPLRLTTEHWKKITAFAESLAE
ncbi:MAG: Zn-dependent exopeptidase M28 [Treponema sp.]|nr:Zn-dependent exopeptidase M28 [Treponema sp.]